MWTIRTCVRTVAEIITLVGLTACTSSGTPDSTVSSILPTQTPVSCTDYLLTPHAATSTPFIASYPCELENSEYYRVLCIETETDGTIIRGCSSRQVIQETIVAESSGLTWIQRAEKYSYGCDLQGISSEISSLHWCSSTTGERQLLKSNVFGNPVPSLDNQWIAFVAAREPLYELKYDVFIVAQDGSTVRHLDTHDFPQDAQSYIHIFEWSDDQEWLKIGVWDGSSPFLDVSGEGWRKYRLRTDGSGEYEAVFQPYAPGG